MTIYFSTKSLIHEASFSLWRNYSVIKLKVLFKSVFLCFLFFFLFLYIELFIRFWRYEEYEYTKLQFCMLLCMGVKLGLRYLSNIAGWVFGKIRTEENSYKYSRESNKKREKKSYTEDIHQMLLAWPHQGRWIVGGGEGLVRRSENRNTYTFMVAKSDGKRFLAKHRQRWQTIKKLIWNK